MVSTGDQTFYYKARMGSGAAARGERIICQLLDWTGANDSLARVRIVHSTVPSIRTGQIGLVPRQRLIPVRAKRED